LVLQSRGCQIDGKKKRVEMNQSIEKNGGFFARLVSKSEEMGSYPSISVGLYPAIKDTGIAGVWSPH
jgi:hypothetical protein